VVTSANTSEISSVPPLLVVVMMMMMMMIQISSMCLSSLAGVG